MKTTAGKAIDMTMTMTKDRNIPLLDLVGQYEGLRAEIRAAIDRVCDSQWFIGGPEVEACEREIAAYRDTQSVPIR